MSDNARKQYPYHRRYLRRKVRLKVELLLGKNVQAWTHNVSENGLCFEIKSRLPIGRETNVDIYIKIEDQKETIHTRCRIVWHDQGKKGFRHGAEIVSFENQGEQKLKEYLSSNN
jgi:hypothetical protein